MPDMNTSIDYRINATNVTAAHGFGDEGAGGAEPSAELPSGYVSDAELLAWLEAKSNGQYDELRDLMNVSTERQKLIQKLSDLKSAIEHAASPEDVEAIKATMDDLLKDEVNAPYAQELHALFDGTLQLLDHTGENPAVEELSGDVADIMAVSAMKDRIASEVDKLGKVDSLALVEIQQLVSDAKETSQLASNVLSSRDQAASSIIGNIRG
jgi:hypothetical protein